jgi:hypothetical protein
MDNEVLYLRPRRRTMLLISLGGLLVAAVGAAASTAFVIVLGAIACVAAGLSLVPGLAYLRLDEKGFEIKKLGKRWGAQWLEVQSFEEAKVLIGRYPTPVVEVHYRDGFAERHLPTSTLGRTVGFSQQYIELGYGLKADAQTALLNDWRSRYGG